jgi:glutamate--cysteine ligase
LLRGAGWADAVTLRAAVPREGLDSGWRGGTLRDLARDAIAIARDGLRARARLNAVGEDESRYLTPLEAIATGGPTQAEYWLERYHQEWKGDVRQIFPDAAI